MQGELGLRQYVVLTVTKTLLSEYTKNDLKVLRELIINSLGVSAGSALARDGAIRVTSAPSARWSLCIVGLDEKEHGPAPTLADLEELVIEIEFSSVETVALFRHFVLGNLGKSVHGVEFRNVGAAPRGEVSDHWCPGSGSAAMLGDRGDARRLLGIDIVNSNGRLGQGVNVVIIDAGLCKAAIPLENWGGSIFPAWPGYPLPGTAGRESHGMLIARNVLDNAPRAVLYDVPLLPERITDVSSFMSRAHVAYNWLRAVIRFLSKFHPWSGPWILVNAWAIADRGGETPLGDYTENTHPFGHPFNLIVGMLADSDRRDVIFGAGNCGQFCRNRRCGKLDRGPGRSIWGANSHSAVMTAGAVRTDETWIGYSSQGPGQRRLWDEKPDFCAPSHFREINDAHVTNTGTSTACGLTAGVVAALRSNRKWGQCRIPPGALKQTLIETAHKHHGAGWDGRMGYGVLDAGSAFKKLTNDYP
jgi:Subtilase family